MPKINKKHITVEQKDMMVAFMLSHKDLAQGRMSGTNYKEESDELYATMTELLNNVENGAVKTVPAWRKSWNDFKRATVEKETLLRKQIKKKEKEFHLVKLTNAEKTMVEKIIPKASFGLTISESGIKAKDREDEEEKKVALEDFEKMEDEDSKEDIFDFEVFKAEEEEEVIPGTSKQIDFKDDSDEASEKKSAIKRKGSPDFLRAKKQKLTDEPIVIESDEEYVEDKTSKIKVTDKTALGLLVEKMKMKQEIFKLQKEMFLRHPKQHEELIGALNNIAVAINNYSTP